MKNCFRKIFAAILLSAGVTFCAQAQNTNPGASAGVSRAALPVDSLAASLQQLQSDFQKTAGLLQGMLNIMVQAGAQTAVKQMGALTQYADTLKMMSDELKDSRKTTITIDSKGTVSITTEK